MWIETYTYADKEQLRDLIATGPKVVILFNRGNIEVCYVDNHDEIGLDAVALLVHRHNRDINEFWGYAMASNGLRHFIGDICPNYQIVF